MKQRPTGLLDFGICIRVERRNKKWSTLCNRLFRLPRTSPTSVHDITQCIWRACVVGCVWSHLYFASMPVLDSVIDGAGSACAQPGQEGGSSTDTVRVYGSSTVGLQCPSVSAMPWPGFGWGRRWLNLAAGWRVLESHGPLQQDALQKRWHYCAVGRGSQTWGDWRTARESGEWPRMWDCDANRSLWGRCWSVYGGGGCGGPWGVGCCPVGDWSVLMNCPSSLPLLPES